MGACNNIEGAQATCSGFALARENDPTVQPGSGTFVYRLSVGVEIGGTSVGVVDLHLRVPEASAADLERTYGGHAPTPCIANIIRPPCNPMMSNVTIPALPIPSYAQQLFY